MQSIKRNGWLHRSLGVALSLLCRQLEKIFSIFSPGLDERISAQRYHSWSIRQSKEMMDTHAFSEIRIVEAHGVAEDDGLQVGKVASPSQREDFATVKIEP